jgi:hypothetical protein
MAVSAGAGRPASERTRSQTVPANAVPSTMKKTERKESFLS